MHFPLFLAAALAIALTPGPGIFYVAGRTLAGGRAEGMASSLGTGLGGFVHVAAGAAGVSALVMASATAFSVLKLLGGLYLVWLGIQTWRSAGAAPDFSASATGRRRAFREGVLVEATNPKTAAFFLAFIPQFVDPAHGHVALQFALLGTVSVVLNTLADVLAVHAAARLRARFAHGTLIRRLRQFSAGILGALGITLLLTRRPA